MKKILPITITEGRKKSENYFFSKTKNFGNLLAIVTALWLSILCGSDLKAQVTVAGSTGADGVYTTLKGAFDAINLNAAQAGNNITIVISASTTETATASLNQPSTSSWTTLTITSTGMFTVSGSIAGAVVKLNGADNVTIDGRIGGSGRNLTIANTSTTTNTVAIWLSSLGVGLGAHDNTIRNCEIACGATQNTSTNTTFGIIMCGATIGATINGDDNDNNSFIDNRIIRCRIGICTRGVTTNNNQNVMVSDNLIGPASFGADEIGLNGILMQADNLSTVTRNTVQFVGGNLVNTTAGADRVGIAIGTGAWSTTATTTITSANYTVTRNLVHDIIEERTFSAVGILVGTTQSGAPTNNLICSNMIYNVRANGTAGDQAAGIAHAGHRADKIVYNSILMTGDLDPAGTASASTNPVAVGIAIHSSSAADTAITVKDNIMYLDLNTNTTTLLKACIIAPASAFYNWASGGSNYNDYWLPNFLNGNVTGVIGTGTTSFSTLANWQTAYTPAQDGSSVQVDPVFISSTDLHITLSSINVSNIGTPVSCTIDFDNEARSGTPDIGADEYTAVTGIDVGATALVTPFATGCYGAAETITVTIKNFGASTHDFAVDPVTVTVNVTGAGAYSDFAVVNSGTLASGATQNVPLATTIDMTAIGTYTFNANTSLAGDVNPGNDAMSAVNRIVPTKISSYPFVEPFTTAPGWTVFVEAPIGSTSLWSIANATGPDGVVSNPGAKSNFFLGSAGRIERLQSPVLDFTSLTNPVVHYYLAYRTYTNFEDDRLDIVISTDCGVTFNPLTPIPYSKQYSSIPSLATLPADGSAFIPAATGNWRHESIDLSDYAGMPNIILGFRAVSAFGNNLWLDNLIVSDANNICNDVVASSGTYNCDGTASILMNTTGDPAGGTLQVTNYTTTAPNPTIAVNTTATTPDGSIFTPESVYATKWFKATYSGNTFNGYSNYDISIDVTGFTPASDIDQLYIMKRTDQLSDWICLPTSAVGNVLTAAGLNLFSDFAVGYTLLSCSNPTATVSGGGTVCAGDPLPDVSIALTGNGPWDITIFDGVNSTMVSGIVTSPYVIMGAPPGTYTVTAISDADCEGTSSGSAIVIVNTPAVTCPSSFSLCIDTPPFTLTGGTPTGGTYTGPGVSSNSFNAVAAGVGTHMITYTITDMSGCTNSCTFNITVNPASTCASNMTWVLLTSGGSCNSTTNCCLDTLCYGLQYTPGVTGTLTTYTTGFFINCVGGNNPIGSNMSCVMDDNSAEADSCTNLNLVLFNSSGNNGMVPVVQGVPIILHKLCLYVPEGTTLTITEDEGTNLSASVDLPFGAFTDQFPDYEDVEIMRMGPVQPAPGSDMVECPDDASAPELPIVLDMCGSSIEGELVSVSDEEDPIVCEGTRIYTYSFTDCSDSTVLWTFTYTIDRTTPPAEMGGPVSTSDMVVGIDNAGFPELPMVKDVCGEPLEAELDSIIDNPDPIVCNGTRKYYYSFTDCSGLSFYWTFIYTIDNVPVMSCPDDFEVCSADPPFPLTGALPLNGEYSGAGVNMGVFSPANAGIGPHLITYTYTNAQGCSNTCTFTITVKQSPVVTCRPSAAVCVFEDPFEITGENPPGGVYVGDGVTGNMFDPGDAGLGLHVITYSYTAENGCTGTCSFVFNVTSCIGTPTIEIIPLDTCDIDTIGTCISQTDCCENILCFAMKYTPGYSGSLTSYTTGFFTDCVLMGVMPVTYNQSCVMDDNSFETDECANFNMVLFNSSGNSGMVPITESVPLILHQVCFLIPPGDTLVIKEDTVTDLTTSIDLTGGSFITEYPEFDSLVAFRTSPTVLAPDGFATVECEGDITAPVPPVAISQCCDTIIGILDTIVDMPDPLTCEGTRVYTYAYEDCGGARSTWHYTYTVEYEPFDDPMDDGSTVICSEDADTPPSSLPLVIDNCGNILMPSDTVVSDPAGCGGTRTYTYTYTDCAGNTQDWVYTYTIDCDSLIINVFLEGPYDTVTQLMRTDLNYLHILPGQDPDSSDNFFAQLFGITTPAGQPYFLPPFNYNGTEGDNYGDDPGDIHYDSTIVDWILLSIRANDSLPESEVWKCAGLLHNDGEVEIPSGCPCLQTMEETDYYIVVEHRNHLPIMSTEIQAVNGNLSFDFTQNQSWIYLLFNVFPLGNGQKFKGGNYVMYSGNSEQIFSRTDINATDDNQWNTENGSFIIYRRADHNMNGEVTATDEFHWLLNNGALTFLPF